MRFYAWWSGMPRQGRTGWTLVVFGTGYILYFLKARLFVAGPPITNKEWLVGVGMLVLIMLGTINIRMAEMRERRQGTLPLVDPNLRSRK
jgi:xanthine/uracil/vitamin C permease (AzgA family)